MDEAPDQSVEDIHGQTARISWPELEIHFARGVVIRVGAELDLVEVATCFTNDEESVAAVWIRLGQVQHLDKPTAKRWSRGETDLWAVVVAPWVLVQEREHKPQSISWPST